MCEAKFFLTQPILPPDVKGVSLPQPETPFNSPIRSRPCPGRLFVARIEHQALPFAQAALAKRGSSARGSAPVGLRMTDLRVTVRRDRAEVAVGLLLRDPFQERLERLGLPQGREVVVELREFLVRERRVDLLVARLAQRGLVRVLAAFGFGFEVVLRDQPAGNVAAAQLTRRGVVRDLHQRNPSAQNVPERSTSALNADSASRQSRVGWSTAFSNGVTSSTLYAGRVALSGRCAFHASLVVG